jgi:bifunctional UDP-N-acetylglucosamine pyrophosphorylase/glucosamine-1-phosphate N-acetyltransferase
MAIQTVILAAGQGKRMHSKLPKVLHHLAGKPLLEHVIHTAWQVTQSRLPIIVYGHEGEMIRHHLTHLNVDWVEQKEQLGTGHALMQAMPHFQDDDQILILYADTPLISSETLKHLLTSTPKNAMGMVTAEVQNPHGYGRIKRSQKNIIGVIEEKDATHDERKITEINPGIYLASGAQLRQWLPQLKNKNAQTEYYLTDMIALSVQNQIPIHAVQPHAREEILGVNDRIQLAQLERIYQRQQAEKWMLRGVTICDPSRLDIRGEVQIGRDVVLDVNVILEGRVVIGDGCKIGPNTILRNTILGADVSVKANSLIDGAEIASGCVVGPFARLRPGTTLESDVHIGNFVEIKNSAIDKASKVNHLSYIGDSEIGKYVNIGAGTITCNYDGMNKHRTIIGDDVHIGSDTQLIAPVTIGEGATIAAGSTIVKDVPPHQLTLTQQIKQRIIPKWQRPGELDKENK